MATRSNIGILNNDNTVTAIYCHSDGYLYFRGQTTIVCGVGYQLWKYYQDEQRVRSLIDLGAISNLGKYLEPQSELAPTYMDAKRGNTNLSRHTFDNRHRHVTTAYHRDRGDDFNQIKSFGIEGFGNEEYNYLFKDGKWYWVTEEFDIKSKKFYTRLTDLDEVFNALNFDGWELNEG